MLLLNSHLIKSPKMQAGGAALTLGKKTMAQL
jgi:hypothetical protein